METVNTNTQVDKSTLMRADYFKIALKVLIDYIGDDSTRPGVIDTPSRVVKSWEELYAGYKLNPKEILSKQFDSNTNQIVVCKDIEFYSMCEHHMLPFHGKVHVGYMPKGKVVGLSKLARLVDVYAKRLQIQEGMTQSIARDIYHYIHGCEGAICVVEAKHLCMCSRGVNKQHSSMVTSFVVGSFKSNSSIKQEFFDLIK